MAFPMVFGVLTMSHPADAGSVRCNDTLHGHKYESYSLFDGDPSQLVELVPEDNGWAIPEPERGGFYLVCRYKGITRPRVVSIPRGVRACRYDKLGVSCK
jgi:hypothetical protein